MEASEILWLFNLKTLVACENEILPVRGEVEVASITQYESLILNALKYASINLQMSIEPRH